MSPKKSTTNERVVRIVREGVEKEGVRGFARETGLSPALVTRYVQGKVGEPTQETLEKLAVYFGVSVMWLRGEKIDLGKAGRQQKMVCAVCGEDLCFDMGYGEFTREGEWIEGDGIIRVSPCSRCCKN